MLKGVKYPRKISRWLLRVLLALLSCEIDFFPTDHSVSFPLTPTFKIKRGFPIVFQILDEKTINELPLHVFSKFDATMQVPKLCKNMIKKKRWQVRSVSYATSKYQQQNIA